MRTLGAPTSVGQPHRNQENCVQETGKVGIWLGVVHHSRLFVLLYVLRDLRGEFESRIQPPRTQRAQRHTKGKLMHCRWGARCLRGAKMDPCSPVAISCSPESPPLPSVTTR